MPLTLRQIVDQIKAVANAHAQIDGVGVGDFAELQSQTREYPLFWIFHERSDITEGYIIRRIRLLCADRVQTGQEGDDDDGMEIEVLSDTQRILMDFIAYFYQQHDQSYMVERVGSIEPFTERFDDRVAGNTALLTFKEPWDYSKCETPISTVTFPPTVDGLTLYDFGDASVLGRLTAQQVADLQAAYGAVCIDATITINGAAYGTVPAGGTENIIVESENNNPLGSLVGGNWEVGNAHLRVNGTTVGNFEPEQWHDHYATINGTQAGAWYNPSQTWRMNVLQGGSPVGNLSGTDWVVPVCADATAVLKNTANTTLSTTSIASGASQNITAPDATAVLKDTAGVTLSTTAIPSNTSTNITAPDGTVQLNGSAYGVVTSGGTINVNSLTYSRLPSKTWRFCYADRSLISGYTGALMQCRIATGGSTFDAVQDANGYMNTPAVVTSRGNDNITTPIIYDQAGSGVNMLQAVVANQPRLAVGSPNGKDRAIMYHAQTPYMQAAQSFALNSTETVYVVCRPNTINGALVCGSGTSWWLEMAGSNTVYVYNGSSYYATSGAVQLYSVCLLTLQLKLNALIVRINGVQILSQTLFALAASTSVTVGARPTGANPNNLGWKALCAHAGELDTSVESALMAAYRI